MSDRKFDIGDMVEDSIGRIGYIVAVGEYPTVKFKDEFENEYCVTMHESELTLY